MNEEAIASAKELAQEVIREKMGVAAAPVGFALEDIILEILSSILADCDLSFKEMKRAAAGKRTLRAKLVVATATKREFRRAGLDYDRHDGKTCQEVVFEMANRSSEEEIAAFAAAVGVG